MHGFREEHITYYVFDEVKTPHMPKYVLEYVEEPTPLPNMGFNPIIFKAKSLQSPKPFSPECANSNPPKNVAKLPFKVNIC